MKFRIASLLLVCILCATTLIADENFGTINGKVTDGATGEPLLRTTVVITVHGKSKGTFSDSKGKYALKNVPAGVYDVRFKFLGYQEKVIKLVEVTPNHTTTVDAVMKLETTTTGDVVIEARASKETEAAILTQRKNASQVSDGVSEEEIKRQSDNDAGQVLKRVSGVTVVGDKFVYVRGINERYNNTTLNGVTLTSTDADKKAFAFDMFPAEFLQNASVVKSFTPDLPGNFAGGLVQLNTVDFPDGYAIRFHASLAGSDNLTARNGAFISYPGGNTDWLGYDNGTRTMPSNLPANRSEMNQLISDTRAYYAGDQSPQHTAAAMKWEALGSSFNNALWNRVTSTAPPNGSFGLSFNNVYTPFGADLGVIASMGYDNGLSLSTMEKTGVSSDKQVLFHYAGTQASRAVSLSALLNVSLRAGIDNTISLRNMYNHASDDESVTMTGYNAAQTRDLKLYSLDFVEKGLLSSQLIGEHILSGLSNLRIDWKAGYSNSTRNQPDYRRLRYSRNLNTEDMFVADIPYPGSQSGDGTAAGRFVSDLQDKSWSGALDFTLPVETVKFKMGASAESRDRSFDTRSFTYIQSKIFSRGAIVGDTLLSQTPDKIFTAANFGPDGLAISEDSKPTDSYTANEVLHAAYFMTDFPFTVAGLEFRFIAGARVEDNSTELMTPYSFQPGTGVADSIISTNLRTTDILPSFNLVYKASPEMNIRASATQTLTRPSLREFAPFAFYDFQNLATIQGNPGLGRALIQNYDLRWEYFPRAAEVFSAGVFYKRFKNAIEETIVQAASEIQRSYDNADEDAVNYGFELEARRNLSFITDYLSNFLVSVNYSMIHSEIVISQNLVTDKRPLWGQSPYSFNASLYFVEPSYRTSFNISYNVSGKRIVQVSQIGSYPLDLFPDPHVYELPRDQVDISISQPVGDNLSFKLSAKDILNQPTVWDQSGVTVSSVQRGRSLSFSFGYSIK